MNLILWNRYHCLALCIASLAFVIFHTLFLIEIITFGSFVWLFIIGRNELKNLKPYGGWANRVTAIRFLALIFLALGYNYLSDLQIFWLLAILIPLDGLDGYLARKRNEQTKTGAYFDMETDVFFVCIVSCILYVRRLAGFEILFAAFFRYTYVLIIYIIGFHRIEERRTKIGPFVAVYVFISLTLAFVVSETMRFYILYSAILLLTLSFSYSFGLLVAEYRKYRKNKNNESFL